MAEVEWHGVSNEDGDLYMNKNGEPFIAPNRALALEFALALQWGCSTKLSVKRLDEAPMTEEQFIEKQMKILKKVFPSLYGAS